MRHLGVTTPLPARADRRPPPGPGFSSQDVFAFRLRLHRERQRMSLRDLAAAMRLKVEYLEALECNDLSAWPRGLYARAWVRTYATLVGLDPADTIDEFCKLFPHGDRRARDTMREIAAILAQPSTYRDEDREVDRRRRTPPAERSRLLHAGVMEAARARLRMLAERWLTGNAVPPREHASLCSDPETALRIGRGRRASVAP